MSNILVPVDFSLASDKALEYALDLMNKEVDTLTILHVYSLPIPDPEMPHDLIAQLHESYKEIAETHIQKLLERIMLTHGDFLDVNGKTVPGSAVAGILDQSKNLHTDLIIMGMRGENKMLRKILGTTATRVIQGTDVPVVIVPEGATYSPIQKIAYASNLEEEDILALDQVIGLANRLDAEVYCVHIQDEGKPVDNYKKDLLEKAYEHDLNQSPIHVDILTHKNIVLGLNTYVEYKEIDLVVMLTHHRSIFNRILNGSSTFEMAFQSAVPVWVFQSDASTFKKQEKKALTDLA